MKAILNVKHCFILPRILAILCVCSLMYSTSVSPSLATSVSAGSTLRLNANSQTVVSNIFETVIDPSGAKLPEINSKKSFSDNSESGIREEFVVLPKNSDDYEFLTNLYPSATAYHNLQAIILNLTTNEAKLYQNNYQSVFKLRSIIPKLSLLASNLINSENRIGKLSTEDATKMRVDELWKLGYSGQGITVAITDNGIDEFHPGLADRVQEQRWFAYEDCNLSTLLDNSTNGNSERSGICLPDHGTPVAGAIAGNGLDDRRVKGNAFSSKLIAASWRMKEGGISYELGDKGEFFFQAFDYLLNESLGIDIINFSGGGGLDPMSQIIVEKMRENNVIYVVSAGNSGPDPESLSCPSCLISAISVAATTRDATNTISSFSSRGGGFFPGMKPDVAAPGVSVLSTTYPGQGYGRVSGTSFSAPLTTGALAALMSGLKAEGYTWNIGTIKAALLRGAFANSGSTGDYIKGAGDVDIKGSWDYLKLKNPEPGFAEGFAVTPLSTKIFETKVPTDINTRFEGITLISSNASLVLTSLSGNITDILSLATEEFDPAKYSQYIPLTLNTRNARLGNYHGNLQVEMLDEVMNVKIQITVEQELKGKVAMDLRHTDWDQLGYNSRTGQNTGETASLFIQSGYWVDEVHDELTDSLLNQYDLLWISDPFYSNVFVGEDITTSELQAIKNFVENGGSLLVSFLGIHRTDSMHIIDGADPMKIDSIIGMFGIHSHIIPSANSENLPVQLNNISSITGPALQLSSGGNYLFINHEEASNAGGTAQALTGSDSQTTFVKFDIPDAGRVLVTSTNYWLDNEAIRAKNEADGDPIVALNSIKWLLSQNQLSREILNNSTQEVQGRYSSSSTVNVQRIASRFLTQIQIASARSGNTHTFSYQFTEDGNHQIEISNGFEYERVSFIRDFEGPVIRANSPINLNITMSNSTETVTFTIYDLVYALQVEDIGVVYNQNELNSTIFSYTFTDTLLTISLETKYLVATDSHVFTITAQDEKDRSTSLDWNFNLISNSKQISTSQNSFFLILPSLSALALVATACQMIRKKLIRQNNHNKL